MNIISLGFILFLIAAAVIYYITPGKVQWVTMLILSIVFYCLAATPYTILFLLFSAVTAYVTGLVLADPKNGDPLNGFNKKAASAAAIAIILNVGIWFLMKGSAYWIQLSAWLHARASVIPAMKAVPIAAAFGMGYYTCQTIGYIVDCSWGTTKPEKNFFKLFLFLSFFPQLTTGPISRHEALAPQFYKGVAFSIDNIERGAQRILWGFFKKLVIAERVSVIVNAVYGNPASFTGLWTWIGALLYPIQIYADFSGSVDVVIGAAEIFGITLPENFNNPFFSQSSQEFWQRWHISLGSWAKDYIMYPVLKSKRVVALTKSVKKKFGKRASKLTSLGIGMFCTWFVMGVWHGNYKFIVGCSIWYWFVMLMYEVLSPFLSKVNAVLHIKEDSFSWVLFRRVRTYVIYAFSMVFFRADGISEAIVMIKRMFNAFSPSVINLWIFTDGSLYKAGLTKFDFTIILVSVIVLMIAAVLRENYGYARNWIAEQGLVFRWFIWIALFACVIVYGEYGPGYHSADFIYAGF
ncbi:D-alanyl-lipoteichoic acid acyltransferase DltB, MBOAT superfamily [Lachnospiraceae bacterium]|nr:D-alanyl-lipoteichoic acid acyltransferase DltB, MBOAT superfamily [Lachnospiraceae bacterium]